MSGTQGPASTRIAAALRERIRSGELAAGDRVPSTREIVRDFGVAMATATRALALLRAEGLVRAVRGVGTVVAHPAGTPKRGGAPPMRRPATTSASGRPPAEPALTLDRVVDTAVRVADAEGLAAVTMRRVAAELGVATMSLYRHVSDKDDLLRHMMNAALAGAPDPAAPADWRARLELACGALWTRFERHPWLAPALSLTRPQALAEGMVFSEHILRALAELDLAPATAFDTQLVLLNYVRGVALSLSTEQEAEADTGQTADEWVAAHDTDLRAALTTRHLPTLRQTMDRLADTGYDPDLQELFRTGLTYLLDGIERRLAQPRRGQRGGSLPGGAADGDDLCRRDDGVAPARVAADAHPDDSPCLRRVEHQEPDP